MVWLQSKLVQYGLVVLLVLGFLAEIFRRGSAWKEYDIKEEFRDREIQGRNKVIQEQTETDGLSSRDLIERMRSRDSDWAGM